MKNIRKRINIIKKFLKSYKDFKETFIYYLRPEEETGYKILCDYKALKYYIPSYFAKYLFYKLFEVYDVMNKEEWDDLSEEIYEYKKDYDNYEFSGYYDDNYGEYYSSCRFCGYY